MTETGLLIAEAAFLILLFLFIWSIVRSSRRELDESGPLVAVPGSAEPAPLATLEVSSPRSARLLDLSIGDTQLIMIFDEGLEL